MEKRKKPWTEEYRPQTIDDIVANEEVIASVRSYINNKNSPHLIFYGVPGTGKTTTVRCFGKAMYGPRYNKMVMEINASEERGIDMIRNKVKPFVSVKPPPDSLIKFKLIILDEADSITDDAQSMLRRVIEKYSSISRFCFICNRINKINLAIKSRCSAFQFFPIPIKKAIKRAKDIARDKGIKYSSSAIEFICKQSKGDMRRVINGLQSASCSEEKLTDEVVTKVLGIVSFNKSREIIKSLIEAPIKESYKMVMKIMKENGYSLMDIIDAIYNQLLSLVDNGSVDEKKLRNFISRCSEIEEHLHSSTDDEQELLFLVSVFH